MSILRPRVVKGSAVSVLGFPKDFYLAHTLYWGCRCVAPMAYSQQVILFVARRNRKSFAGAMEKDQLLRATQGPDKKKTLPIIVYVPTYYIS